VRQERLEEAGHRSPKWEVLRSLQQVYGARKVRGCTIINAPPFFESAVVMVWDGMTQEEQVIAQTAISGEKDWVVWRTKPAQSKLGENAAGDQIHQEATAFRGVWYEARGSTASRVKVPKKVRKWVWRRLHKKEGLVSPK
jgi:hypothetical protein